MVAFAAFAKGSILPSTVIAKSDVDSEYNPNPQYSFGYDVQDSITGDSKSHVETRNGDVVRGQYSVVDSDGTKRTVDYTADPVNGFNAVVSKTPLLPAPAAAPVAEVTPVVTKVSAPIVPKVTGSVAAVAAKVAAPIAYTAPAEVTVPYSTSISAPGFVSHGGYSPIGFRTSFPFVGYPYSYNQFIGPRNGYTTPAFYSGYFNPIVYNGQLVRSLYWFKWKIKVNCTVIIH